MKIKSTASEHVTFTVQSKELDGILTLPNAKGPFPAIVLLHGSDRAGAQNPYYLEHANRLVKSGYAILRYDGPGWGGGASEGPGFETLAFRTEEALAAIRYLKSRPDIHTHAVGLWGVSQGGWICQMAAASYPEDVAFIISVSGPGVSPIEQEIYRVEMESQAAGLDDEDITKAVLMRRLMADIVLNDPRYEEVNQFDAQRLGSGPWQDLVELVYVRKVMEPATELERVIALLAGIKEEAWTKALHLNRALPMFSSFPPNAWTMVKAQMRAVLTVSPADFLTRVHCPVLALFGEADTAVPVEESVSRYKAYLRAAGNNALTIKVFPEASHTLKVGETFVPGYFDFMTDWLENLNLVHG